MKSHGPDLDRFHEPVPIPIQVYRVRGPIYHETWYVALVPVHFGSVDSILFQSGTARPT